MIRWGAREGDEVVDLARLLADGRFHSGSQLAAALGLSRAGVWKRIARLRELGVDVQAVTGRGYRVAGGIDLLDSASILASLTPEARAFSSTVDVFECVDSTNAVAASRARVSGGNYVCLAEMQTAGRGRRGRGWVSPFGAAVYLSLAREFVGGYAAVEGLSIATGVLVAEALRRLGAVNLGVKWPNDLVVGNRKAGGILIELSGDLTGTCSAIIGIGINVRMPAQAGTGIDQPWIDLAQLGVSVDRNAVVAALLNELGPGLALFERAGLQPFLARWATLDACRDLPVVMLGGPGDAVEGIARGVDLSGALRVETPGGLRLFKGGEVSLRWSPP